MFISLRCFEKNVLRFILDSVLGYFCKTEYFVRKIDNNKTTTKVNI